MPKVALNDALGALEQALDGADELSLTDRERLYDLKGEIELVLERTDEIQGDGGKKVQATTLTAVQELEGRHPALTAVLNRLANVLTSLGI